MGSGNERDFVFCFRTGPATAAPYRTRLQQTTADRLRALRDPPSCHPYGFVLIKPLSFPEP